MASYSLTESDHFWEIPLAGRNVTACRVDYAMGLTFWEQADDSAHIRLATEFRLSEADGTTHVLEADKNRRALAPALDCFGKEVEHARAWKDGRLELVFTDGTRIDVAPHERFEAWEVTGPGQINLVCVPGGGEPAIWG